MIPAKFSAWGTSRILWVATLLLIPGVLLHSLFSKVFKCPSCFLFDNNADGLKNYFTLDYYVQHDAHWHFSGMNYPYGEHIIYTDNQPLLAMTLRWIHHHIVDMGPHVVGTLNILLLISIYLAVIITYLLLRRWSVGRWWALGAALCLTFLSPQLWRLQGHYGLGYVFFLPLLILLLDLMMREKTRQALWGTLTGLLVIIMSLTHLYFLLLSGMVIFSMALFWYWHHRRNRHRTRQVMPWLVGAAIVPGLFLLGLRQWTDPVQDRPTEPYGLHNHTITFESTFFSFIPPMDKAWTPILGKDRPIVERTAYVGIMGLLLLPALLYFLFRPRDEEALTLHMKTMLGAAILTWCMAAGVFYQNGLSFLWDLLPPLKQFRGLGRFGIPFYYLYLLVATYLLWHLYVRLKDRGMITTGKYMLSVAFVIWGFEAWLNIQAVRAPVFHSNTFLASSKTDYMPLLTDAGYSTEDFQAILQLPLVAIGNEVMGVTRGFWTLREGIHAATETGLPLINYAMSRTSVSQGLDIVALISSPFAPKQRAAHFNEKDILLLCEEEFVLPDERRWIDRAQPIGRYGSITLYRLPVSAFTSVSLPDLPSPWVDQICNGWFDGFEYSPCDTTMSGIGAVPVLNAPHQLWSYTDTAALARDWIVSFWAYVDPFNAVVPVPRMTESNAEGQLILTQGFHRDNIPWSEAYGEWLEIRFPLSTKGGGHHYQLFIDNTGPVIDNLLIRPAGDTCLYKQEKMILFNNLPIPQAQ